MLIQKLADLTRLQNELGSDHEKVVDEISRLVIDDKVAPEFLMDRGFSVPADLLLWHGDAVNSPSHYRQGDIECIDAIRAALGEDGFRAFCIGNAIKYHWRADHKGKRAEDLAKAVWYSRMAAGDDPRRLPLPEVVEERLTGV